MPGEPVKIQPRRVGFITIWDALQKIFDYAPGGASIFFFIQLERRERYRSKFFESTPRKNNCSVFSECRIYRRVNTLFGKSNKKCSILYKVSSYTADNILVKRDVILFFIELDLFLNHCRHNLAQ